MALDPITAALDLGGKLVDRFIPDATANAKAKADLLQMQVSGELSQIAGQLDINKAEASSGSVFVAGWRPFVGWVCGSAFAWAFVLQPFAQFLLVALHVQFDQKSLPTLDISAMMPVLLGMLGLGAMRSVERIKGAIPPINSNMH